MENSQVYTIPHACYLCEQQNYFLDDEEVGFLSLMGRYPEAGRNKFRAITEIEGLRHIQLIERVRDHWVVDTWLTSGEHATDKQTKLRAHKYLKQLLRGSNLVMP